MRDWEVARFILIWFGKVICGFISRFVLLFNERDLLVIGDCIALKDCTRTDDDIDLRGTGCSLDRGSSAGIG
jgi:hypothetical protein